jgi:hypothetical protein
MPAAGPCDVGGINITVDDLGVGGPGGTTGGAGVVNY